MTKRDWDKVGQYVPDPGAMRQAPEVTRPVTVETEPDRERKRAAAREKRKQDKERGFQILMHEIRHRLAVAKQAREEEKPAE